MHSATVVNIAVAVAAYTFYCMADSNLYCFTAYKVYGGLQRWLNLGLWFQFN